MEAKAVDLAQDLVTRLKATPKSARLLVGLAGVPASGKSSLAELVVRNFEALIKSTSCTADSDQATEAVAVSLDGWHLTRSQLDGLEDPELAHARRGAHWTFDSQGYTAFIRRLREEVSPDTPMIYAPSFDHAVKDPTPDAISITPRHRVVLIEGLYTLLSVEPWSEAAELLDERWIIQVDPAQARQRLVKRHVLTGVTKDWEEGYRRCEENDMPNGTLILDHLFAPTKTIDSVQDPLLELPDVVQVL